MSMNSSKARLAALTKDIAGRWAQTRESWRDAKCREFDEHYMEQLVSSVNVALTNIDTLERVINKIRSDCE